MRTFVAVGHNVPDAHEVQRLNIRPLLCLQVLILRPVPHTAPLCEQQAARLLELLLCHAYRVLIGLLDLQGDRFRSDFVYSLTQVASK